MNYEGSRIKEVSDILKGIANTSSRKAKEEIISDNKDDELFKDVLYHLYNPYIKTNIASKKLKKKVDCDYQGLNSMYDYLVYLSDESTGKDEDIMTIQKYISAHDEELHWLLECLATKTMKIGITGKTINKAFGEEFIPQFELMLSEPYVEVDKHGKVTNNYERLEEKEVIVTKKLDGYRCAVINGEEVKLYSREGNEFIGCIDIEEAFKYLPKGFVYDGEILATNEEGLNSEDLFKKTGKILKKKGVKKGLQFNAFDMLPINDFTRGISNGSALGRKELLHSLISAAKRNEFVYVTPLYHGVFDLSVIEKLSLEMQEQGEEGVMVQDAHAPYECKRTFGIQKVKVFKSADVKCLDVYEGISGKNVGSLGGIIVDFKGVEIKVGGGFTDEERKKYWSNPDEIIGKIVEIKYFREFYEDGNLSDLRFATYKVIRDDKTEPSYH